MSLQKINKVCLLVAKLTDEDILEATKQVEQQLTYIHPLKNAKASRINKTGSRNYDILQEIKRLRKALKQD